MISKTLLCYSLMLAPAAASAATFYQATLGDINSSGVTGYIDFTLNGDTLSVDLEASGLADGVHFLHIHGLDAALGSPINTTPPPPPLPPNGDTDHNNAVTTPEAKAAVGNVILSLAPHPLGTAGELVGVNSVGGMLSFKQSYDLTQDIYEPLLPGSNLHFTEADLLPLDYRVFDMHGGIVPADVIQNGTTTAPGTYDPNLPIAAGKIAAVPEPMSWVTMTIGFGLLGAAARRRRAAPTYA